LDLTGRSRGGDRQSLDASAHKEMPGCNYFIQILLIRQ